MIAVILIVVVVAALVAVVLAAASVRVLREYERGIVFRLGRVIDQKGPGLVLLIPAVDRMVRVTLRTVTLRIPPQDVITRDNVPVRVAAVAYFRVIDPRCSVVEVEDFNAATLQIAQTTLRSVLGKAELDTLLSERERLNESLQQIIDEQTEPWGIKVTIVEIKDVEIPERMQHALARQAEAERNRRAKVINAEGEFQAAAPSRRRRRGDPPEPGHDPAALPPGAVGDQRQPGNDDRVPAPDGRAETADRGGHRRRRGRGPAERTRRRGAGERPARAPSPRAGGPPLITAAVQRRR